MRLNDDLQYLSTNIIFAGIVALTQILPTNVRRTQGGGGRGGLPL
mgnify:CR=1 FL=1